MKAFFDAAAMGNVEAMKKYLEQQQHEKESLDQVDASGRTALHHAVAGNHKHAVEWLIDRKASLDIQNLSGDTPLMVAAANINLSMAQLLLRRGAKCIMAFNKGVAETALRPLVKIRDRNDALSKEGKFSAEQEGWSTERVQCYRSLFDLIKNTILFEKNKIVTDIMMQSNNLDEARYPNLQPDGRLHLLTNQEAAKVNMPGTVRQTMAFNASRRERLVSHIHEVTSS